MEPKVSLISPCYNGAEFLKHYLVSLIEQDYSNVEFILILGLKIKVKMAKARMATERSL